MKHPIVFASLILLTFTQSSCLCQGIDSVMRGEDKRLDKSVSATASHIALGKLLSRFSEQSGINLDIDSLEDASGYDLLVQCKDVPVGQMMDALYSLFSTRGAEWKWLRQGSSDHYSYLLVEGQQAKQRPERYRNLGRQKFREYMAMMRRLSEMEPAARLNYKKELRSTLKLDSDEALTAFLKEPDFWSGAKVFFGVLAPGQQDTMLDDGSAFTFQTNQLPAPILSEFRTMFAAGEHSSIQADGSLKRDPDPEEFTISVSNPKAESAQLAPEVRIKYKNSFSMTMLGTGYPSYTVRATVLNDWFMPGDSVDNKAGDRVVPDKHVRDPLVTQEITSEGRMIDMDQPGAMALHLIQMAEGTSVPILAVLPETEMGLVKKPANRSVRELLSLMQRGMHEMSKWRGGTLLLNNPDWFLENEPAVPYRWLRLLDGSKKAPASVADFVTVNSKINSAQAQWLGHHQGLSGFSRLGPLLNYANQHQKLLTTEGFEIGIDDLPFFVGLAYLRADTRRDRPIRVRLVPNMTPDGQIKPMQIRVESANPDRKRWVLSTIQDLPQPIILLESATRPQ